MFEDQCSSAGSESCWGETESIGDDEAVEYGVLSLLSSIDQGALAHPVDTIDDFETCLPSPHVFRIEAASAAPRKRLSIRMGRESQATTVVGVESSDRHPASPVDPLGSANPEVIVERIGSQVVANTMGRVAMLATNVDDDLPATVAAFNGSHRNEHAPAEVFLADGDTESAMSEDVSAHYAEHNVIPEDVWGPFSSVGSDEDFEESIVGEQELPSAVHDSEETFEVGDPPRNAVLQAAFRSVDEVDVCCQFRQRASVMKSVSRFLKGSFCKVLKVALNEIVRNRGEVDLERA